jgi:hypothetical protein
MPVVPDDITATMARDVEPILDQGERLAVAAIITASDPGATGPVRVAPELGNLAVRLLTLGLLGENTQLMRRVLFGRAVAGPEGSLAHSLHALVDEATWAKLVVTDQRVIVARGELLDGGRYRFTVVGALPRTAVTGAAPAPKGLLRRGRTILSFVDGSTAAVNVVTKQAPAVGQALAG